MILSFKPQFIEPIQSGQKIHTIREDLGDRWHEGRQIEFATGVRTKNYRQFNAGFCIGLQKIEIWEWYGQAQALYNLKPLHFPYNQRPCILVDGKLLDALHEVILAFNDGFNSLEDFYAWFLPQIDQNPVPDNGNRVWVGKIIHWTAFKY